MLFFSWAALLVSGWCIAATTAAELEARYQHYVVTGTHTGVNQATGARPARRNILDLQEDAPSWSLYIQALAAMQSLPESDLLSYYQIAGIHGRPYTSWDNVAQGNNSPITGYCTHDSVLFLTWHRPYLALYEQVLVGHVQAIASTYATAGSQIWQAAADNFRVPYWDWASTPEMPDVVNAPTLAIMTPSGYRNVSNPLLQYKFQNFPLSETYFPSSSQQANDWYLAAYPQTVRTPDTYGDGSDFVKANSVLANGNLRYQAYYALTKSTDFDNFATQIAWGPSIENVHNLVHVSIGGSWGHMSQLSYSSFDPIFWLHHVNVDRFFAIYQAMYPNSYLTPFPETYGTYTLQGGGKINDTLSTPLKPFSTDTRGGFYTSRGSRSLSTFGYSYPGIEDWNHTPEQLQANVTAHVNALYGSSNSLSKRDVLAPRAEVTEWSVTIGVSKFDLGGLRFIIRIFLGDIPENPSDWATSDACVGSFVMLPPPSITGPLPQVLSYNEIGLTEALKARGYDGQDLAATIKYLEEGLQWRVQLINGTVVSTDQLKTLSIAVQREIVSLASSIYELPTYGEKTIHPGITKGKVGGYSHEVWSR